MYSSIPILGCYRGKRGFQKREFDHVKSCRVPTFYISYVNRIDRKNQQSLQNLTINMLLSTFYARLPLFTNTDQCLYQRDTDKLGIHEEARFEVPPYDFIEDTPNPVLKEIINLEA